MSQGLLPPASTPLERAIEDTIARISGLPVGIGALWSPADCPEDKLPWLAWAFGVEVWDKNWGHTRRREQISASIPIKRIKGSIGAVKRALGELGFGTQVIEWFASGGAPYTYTLRIEVDQIGWDLEDLDVLQQLVARTRNLRSHLDKIIPSVKTQSRLYVGAVTTMGTEISIDSGLAFYADGAPATDLSIHIATYGLNATLAALATIHKTINQDLPQVTS